MIIPIINTDKTEISLSLNFDFSYWALPLCIYWVGYKEGFVNKYFTFHFLCFSVNLEVWLWKQNETTNQSR